MYFDSLPEFLAMGGHGLYVWMAYGAFVLVLAWNILRLKLNRQQQLATAYKTWQREELKANANRPDQSSSGAAS